ncbi:MULTISPECIES: heme-binding protein [unclassified Methylophilus]|uniref:heme-binding protein n=1 Tax=unclassified Methylophilus TaxID=2630143 RepID=UPI0003661377|nr:MULTISPECIES: heme-binding protein [unclassified Methylophilus]
MLNSKGITEILSVGRSIKAATSGDPALGPLSLLPGVWKNLPSLPGRGWNLIALPFATPRDSQFPFNYRLLMNQYNEELRFSLIDKGIPNRGINRTNSGTVESDQLLVALDYEQSIVQIAADDAPNSSLAGNPGAAIHHEPGLWLHILNETESGLDIARLATIPHGDSVLAMGRASTIDGPPNIPDISGLPTGVRADINNNPYLGPYKAFHGTNKFRGLFDPATPNDLLREANTGVKITRTTILDVDTDIPTGGISNIPFIVKQANATSMRSTFWIQELSDLDESGKPKLRLQYSQTVMLDFFPRTDGTSGLIRWPHISINTLEKVSD